MSQPHIILVITDQQRFDTIAALGHDYMKTPNLDRLVREGVYFENCFVNAPSCVRSRAALFSGFYPHASGVLRNDQAWQRTWKAVFIHGAEDGQLFDLEDDPTEENNLWGLAAYAETTQYLKDAMIDWRQNSLLETMDLHGASRHRW